MARSFLGMISMCSEVCFYHNGFTRMKRRGTSDNLLSLRLSLSEARCAEGDLDTKCSDKKRVDKPDDADAADERGFN